MSRVSQSTSFVLHVIVVALLLLWSVHPAITIDSRPVVHLYDPLPARTLAGGGGQHQTEPARKGVLPPPAVRVFNAPLVQRVSLAPVVNIEAPPDVTVKSAVYGDPNGFGNLSGGPGEPFGIGNGHGPSVGNGTGPHYGDGDDGIYSVGHGVTAPVPIHMVDPEYSEAARKVHLSGSVLVSCEIDPEGHPRNLRVVQSMGMGLDEKALEAVAKWLFRPGTRNGRPVTVKATFEVNFRLL